MPFGRALFGILLAIVSAGSCPMALVLIALSGLSPQPGNIITPTAPPVVMPAPVVVETNFCSDISPSTGANSVATESMNFSAAENVLDAATKNYYACVVTNKGIIELTLFDDNAPITVNNFVFLAQSGFYDGVLWHRVIEDFMAQGGDRNGAIAGRPGTGGPGYSWNDEPAALTLQHTVPGTLSMANAGPNTNGSQFFITHVPTPWLDGIHAVFGQVSGAGDLDVLRSLANGDLIQTIQIIEVDS